MCGKIEHWTSEREQENLVEDPDKLDLYLNKNFGFAKLSWMAKKIAKEFQFVLLRFVLKTEVFTHRRFIYFACVEGGVRGLMMIVFIGSHKN